MPQYKTVLLALLAIGFAGCSQPTVPDPDPTDSTMDDGSANTDGYDDGSFGDGSALPDDSMDMDAGPALIVYFDYDSSEWRPEDTDTGARHAQQIGMNSGMRVRLEGHADERGSREYNIALGDRRALSVQRVLELNGVAPGQVSVVSYGEEKPAAEGHSEAAWRLNRRVEIVYQGQ